MQIDTDRFDSTLMEILRGYTAEQLVAMVPGIYSEVAEEFNNGVLRKIAEDQETPT